MKLDPKRTSLVVVDMQNDFCHPDGELYSEASEAAIEPINKLINRARNVGANVFFTRDTHTEKQFESANYYDEYNQWGKHCELGSWGWEIHDAIDVRLGEYAITKDTYDAFHETRLEEYLRNLGTDNLVIVGTLANVCVLHTAASAGQRDFKPVIVNDCVGYIEEEQKERALEHAEWLFGEVVESDELVFEK